MAEALNVLSIIKFRDGMIAIEPGMKFNTEK